MEWLQQLQRWIRQLFKPKKKRRTSPKIIKRWYGKYCAILRIERTTPGGLATYRITSPHGSCDYLVTLDYLPDLHGEVFGKFQGTTIKIRANSSPHTHRFAVWRVFPNGNSTPINVWDVDLEGFTQSFAMRELAPRRACAGVASLALLVVHENENPLLNWQSQMECINWLFFLEKRIREELSNPNHNLKASAVIHS
ncbi:MAG: hypothetical protein V7K21_20115 [Nostoc sp.]|uniref:hypothetical protein n=1 Tax=Nostoc sp. TaxID=1180 RepID=UPI002FF630CB